MISAWMKNWQATATAVEWLLTCHSSFQNTDLDYQLRKRGITKVAMAGLVANTCLESTARYAYEL